MKQKGKPQLQCLVFTPEHKRKKIVSQIITQLCKSYFQLGGCSSNIQVILGSILIYFLGVAIKCVFTETFYFGYFWPLANLLCSFNIILFFFSV